VKATKKKKNKEINSGASRNETASWRMQHVYLNYNTTKDLLEIQKNLRGFIFNEFNDYGNVGPIMIMEMSDRNFP
jgi:hypothetical protein